MFKSPMLGLPGAVSASYGDGQARINANYGEFMFCLRSGIGFPTALNLGAAFFKKFFIFQYVEVFVMVNERLTKD
ncbi:MAG: hypothetical protein V3R85_05050 [Alphaproteobacteria bacterium]